MKTSELTGAQLDYWVAKALGGKLEKTSPTWGIWTFPERVGSAERYWKPSIQWDHGGPIIEREGISLWRREGKTDREFWVGTCCIHAYTAKTPLEAAMRAYVASKYGDEVQNTTID